MSQRNYSNGGKLYSMHAKLILTTCTIQIGASGAVSSFAGATLASVVRASAGVYTITLQPLSGQLRTIHASGAMQSPPTGLSGIMAVEIQNAPTPSMSVSAAPTLTVKCLNASGALADPASGSALTVLILGNDSTVIS